MLHKLHRRGDDTPQSLVSQGQGPRLSFAAFHFTKLTLDSLAPAMV